MANRRSVNLEELTKEMDFSASISGGPGGQHANKVNTKVTVRFDVGRSYYLSEEEKVMILKKLSSRITNEGVLVLSSQEKRSQLQNKQAVIKKAETLLNSALAKKKPRKPTKPSKTAIQQRIRAKKQRAEKKKWRQNPGFS